MTVSHVIGIDPGPTPGFVMLTLRGRHLDVDVVQCSASVATVVLYALLDQHRASLGTAPCIVAVERFVVGRGSGVSGRAGSVTRDLVGKLEQVASDQPNVTVVQETASRAKAWATDCRLQAAVVSGDSSLYLVTAGMRHARDGARHALFAAVQHGGLPDPLSKGARP